MRERRALPQIEASDLGNSGWYEVDDTVWVRCPGCLGVGTLGDHDVDEDGRVTPSLECPNDGCDFHEHVVLEDWSEA